MIVAARFFVILCVMHTLKKNILSKTFQRLLPRDSWSHAVVGRPDLRAVLSGDRVGLARSLGRGPQEIGRRNFSTCSYCESYLM